MQAFNPAALLEIPLFITGVYYLFLIGYVHLSPVSPLGCVECPLVYFVVAANNHFLVSI